MKYTTLATAVALVSTIAAGTVHATTIVPMTTALPTIVNLDATQGMGSWGAQTDAAPVSVYLQAGTYNVRVFDNTANGGYNGWNYNTGTTVREAFDVSINGSTTYSIDVAGATKFTSYDTPAAALAAFATGPYTVFGKQGGTYDSSVVGTLQGLQFTLTSPAAVTFGIPDNNFSDNHHGVSLAITAAVPEPQTYALMLAGLGAVGFLARRRHTRA